MNERYCIEQAVIELKNRIRDYGAYLRKSEIRTRRSLIDPMLKALGWDAADPGHVMLEYRVGKAKASPVGEKEGTLFDNVMTDNSRSKVDYALMKPDRKPLAMIEAKRLGAKLHDPNKDQLFNYVDRSDVQYAGLTNGDRWTLYFVTENMRQKPLDRRRVFHVSIAEDRMDECVEGLEKMLRSRLLSGGDPKEARLKAAPPAPVKTTHRF